VRYGKPVRGFTISGPRRASSGTFAISSITIGSMRRSSTTSAAEVNSVFAGV